ncbi:MAG: PTS sugar transporter subunit IIC [Gemmatimonadota bacterium]|nr:PTS sugar transporter subunit IIC [Gemmatimonadota bacterium]
MLLLLCVLVALDSASLGQFMISRPLVAATLSGWIVGDPEGGVMIGLVLELLQLPFFQIGGTRVSEGGLGAVVGAAVLAEASGPGGLAFGVLLGLVVANLGGFSVDGLHRRQAATVPQPADGRLTPAALGRFHLGGLARDALRGAVVGGVGLGVAVFLGETLAGGWLLDAPHTDLVLLAAASFSVGAFFHNLGAARRSMGALLVGALLGLAVTVAVG